MKTMKIDEIFAQMNSGALTAHSELNTRNESKQTRSFSARFRKMPIATGIRAHALVMKDIVVRFNPFTGEKDDLYNDVTPFRPILLASQTIAGIKSACASNEALAAKWASVLGKELDWGGEVTLDDYYAFKEAGMVKPRIMSYATVAMNFNGAHGFSQYRQRYSIDPTKLNESYGYDSNPPTEYQGAMFFHAMLRPEWEKAKAALEQNHANKETMTSQRQAIFAKSPIGFPTPSNLIPFIYLPLDEDVRDIDENDTGAFEQFIRFTGYSTDKWQTAMSEVLEKNLSDDNIDYYDFTINTPSKTATKNDGKVYTDNDTLEIYKAMTISVTDSRRSAWTGTSEIDKKTVPNSSLYAKVLEAAKNYFMYSQEQSGIVGGDTFEKLMAASNGFRPIDTVYDKLLPACYDVFKASFENSEYFTDAIRDANSDFYIAMNPHHAMALADAEEEELTEAAAKQKESMASIMASFAQDAKDAVGDINFDNMQISDT